MQRAGKPVHINDTLTDAVHSTNPVKYFIPRRNTLRTYTAGTPPTDQVHTDARTQDLFGPERSSPARSWNRGGGAISPNTTTTGPTVSGVTGLTWNDGGGSMGVDAAMVGNRGPGARTKSMTIRNSGTSAQDDIMISFDNGTNYFTLAPGENFDGEVSIHYFLVKRTNTEEGLNGIFEAIAILA